MSSRKIVIFANNENITESIVNSVVSDLNSSDYIVVINEQLPSKFKKVSSWKNKYIVVQYNNDEKNSDVIGKKELLNTYSVFNRVLVCFDNKCNNFDNVSAFVTARKILSVCPGFGKTKSKFKIGAYIPSQLDVGNDANINEMAYKIIQKVMKCDLFNDTYILVGFDNLNSCPIEKCVMVNCNPIVDKKPNPVPIPIPIIEEKSNVTVKPIKSILKKLSVSIVEPVGQIPIVESVKQIPVKQESAKLVKQESAKLVKQESAKPIKQGSAKLVKQGSAKLIKQGSAKPVKQGSAKPVKQVSNKKPTKPRANSSKKPSNKLSSRPKSHSSKSMSKNKSRSTKRPYNKPKLF